MEFYLKLKEKLKEKIKKIPFHSIIYIPFSIISLKIKNREYPGFGYLFFWRVSFVYFHILVSSRLYSEVEWVKRNYSVFDVSSISSSGVNVFIWTFNSDFITRVFISWISVVSGGIIDHSIYLKIQLLKGKIRGKN